VLGASVRVRAEAKTGDASPEARGETGRGPQEKVIPIDWGPILRDLGGMPPKTADAAVTQAPPPATPSTRQDLRDASLELVHASSTGSVGPALGKFAAAMAAEMQRQIDFDAQRASAATPKTPDAPTK